MNGNLNWDDILFDIEEKRAVLLLGHAFLPNAQQQLHRVFLEHEDIGPSRLLYFYERDGLFLFADDDAKTTAQKAAARYFKQCSPDPDILKKIARLPFKLIVSANPDISLTRAFAQYRIPHQFDYYSCEPKEAEPSLMRPSPENPLIYNLCGSCEDYTSLLLDYDDLFSLLKNLLANTKVPDSELRLPLKSATTFIFFGFHFERWYTQLFLRYLNQSEGQFSQKSRNYALKTTFSEEDTRQFFMKQFNVRYVGADADFFEELYRRFSEKQPGMLRNLVDELSQTAATVLQLIERNDIGSAISMIRIFEERLDSDYRDLLLQTSAMYSQYLQEKDEPAQPQEYLTNLLNRVRRNLREISKKLP